MRRNTTIFAFVALMAVSASGQDRGLWRTAADVQEGASGSIIGIVVDVDEARGKLSVAPDDDKYQHLSVVTDSLSTQYNGFGGTINGSPEIYRGSTGFANIREGDRLQIRGSGRASATLMADQITLMGRSVEASQVGVGQTRTGTGISTPSATSSARSTTVNDAFAEGTVRQVNVTDGRIVIQTPQRRMINVRANRNTPIYYRGEVYRLANLEVGDYIRVEADARDASSADVTARSIEVTQSVQDTPGGTSRDQRLTSVVGRVTKVESTADMVRVNTGRADVRVDMVRAIDSTGRRLRARDLKVGDRVDVTGSYSSNSEVFVASTVRFEEGGVFEQNPERRERDDDRDREPADYVTATMSGTVTESLDTSPTLIVKDRATGRTVEIFVTEDFIYRTKAGSYATADKLKNGDSLLIKAFRDENGNLIAQTIRIR